MRPGETRGMRGRDLAPGEEVWIYRPGSHKTAWRGKRREIPLGPKAVELIRGFLKADAEAFLFSPSDAVAEHNVRRRAGRKTKPTPSERGKRVASPGSRHSSRYSRSSYRYAVLRACDKAFPHPTVRPTRGRPVSNDELADLASWREAHRWHPNQLRHTVATEVRSRFGLEASQVVLGHSKADVTQVYAERDLTKAVEVMRLIG
jgi:integrase